MQISGVDISVFNAKQLKVDIQPSSIIITKEWLKKSLSPLFLSSDVSFKQIQVEILFKGNSRDEILRNISNLTAKLIGEADLKLDGYSNNYKVTLANLSTEKTVSKSLYTVKIEFLGYEYGDLVTETANRIGTKTINVNGNSKTPAIIEITPSSNLIDIVVTGAGDTFTMKNLTAGQKVIINGEDGTVLQSGVNKFTDFDGWEFPKLTPGSCTLTFSQVNCDINIKYKPRWI